jgi:hypothetical protein
MRAKRFLARGKYLLYSSAALATLMLAAAARWKPAGGK